MSFGPAVDDTTLANYSRDDIGNAERFLAREGENVRQSQRLGTLVWDGRRWAMDDGGVQVALKAQRVARAMRAELDMLRAQLKAKPDDEVLQAGVKAHAGWLRQSSNSQRLNGMLVQAMPHLNVPFEVWNHRSDVMCLPCGVLDLSSLEPQHRPHRREDMITRMAATPYKPDAAAPRWRAFLERVLPDPEIRAFVKRTVGSCLVDSASDQVVMVFHGGGANGKSTFLDVVCDVLGDYAMTASINSFLANDKISGSSAQPDMVRLAYRPRLVRTSEPPPGARLAEGMIKEVTGGEEMVARDLHEKPLAFRVNWKLFISCNNRPSVRGGDDGIWRRIRLVPWSVQIPEGERDPDLKSKLLEEREGILLWLLEGWADWRERGGLDAPQGVLEASDAYRAESDAVGRFLNEWCVREGEVAASLLHDAFEAWCKAEGMDPISGNLFGRRLSDRGFGARKSNGITLRIGLSLSEAARTAAYEREADRLQRGRKTELGP